MKYRDGSPANIGDSVVLDEIHVGPEISVHLEIHGTMAVVKREGQAVDGLLKNVTIKKIIANNKGASLTAFMTPESAGIAPGCWYVTLGEASRCT